jgi:hypothetical protein
MFRAHVLIVRRAKSHYTASGIITPVGGRPMHRLRESCLNLRHMFRRRGMLQYFMILIFLNGNEISWLTWVCTSPFKGVISRKTSWAELLVRILKVRNICRILVGNIWSEYVGLGLEMIVKRIFDTCCECVDWLHVSHDSVQCRAVLNKVVNTEDGNMVFKSVRISKAMWT